MKRDGALECYPDGSIVPESVPGGAATEAARDDGGKGKVLSYHDARAKVESLKAERLQHDLDVSRGRYIDSKAVEDAQTQLALLISEGLEDASEQIVAWFRSMSGLPEHEIRAGVESRIYEIREALADEIESRTG